MTNLILLFPLVACIILFFIKNRFVNNFMMISYAVLQFIVSLCFCLNIDLLPMWNSSKFFAPDSLNKVFLMVLSIVYLAFVIYNSAYMKDDKSILSKLRNYACMVILFVFSMSGAILSTNLGITWIFLEGATLASAYLVYFHKRKHSVEAAWKYVFICSIGIALAFVGIILLTIATGNLDSLFYKDLYLNAQTFNHFWLKMSFVFILFGIGTKMGLAPLHFWLPDAYAESPSPVTALLSATLTNSAFLMILNVFKIMIFAGCDNYARLMMFVMGFLSLFVASVFVYHIHNYKRMLAYSSIENMGVLIIGTALGGVGMLAAIIHLIGHSFIKAAFFMSAGNILKIYGTKKIKAISGICSIDSKTAWLWVASFIALVAFPPSILFISEFLIVKTMILNGNYLMSAIFLLLLTIILYGIGKAVISMTFSKNNADSEKKNLPVSMYFPQVVLLILTFVMGFYMPNSLGQMILMSVKGF